MSVLRIKNRMIILMAVALSGVNGFTLKTWANTPFCEEKLSAETGVPISAFDRIKPDSAEWKNWMSSDSARRPTPLYLESAHHALTFWIEKKQNGFETFNAFKAALDEMQLRSSRYFRLTGIDAVQFSIADFKFGRTRDRIDPNSGVQPVSVGFPADSTESFNVQIGNLLRRQYRASHYRPQKRDGSANEKTIKGEIVRVVYGGRSYPVKVTSIRYLRNHIFAEIERNFPSGKKKTIQLETQADSEMAFLRYELVPANRVPSMLEKAYRLFLKIETDRTNSSNVLPLIADYFQNLIVAHPYTRVNHSVFMNQVNEMLFKLGMHPVYHRDLDFWAFGLSSDVFRTFFIDYVRDPTNWAF